jgi:6,7-dimethyl-8-ribityllumazine synthase
MSRGGAPATDQLDGSRLRVAIVAASWHATVMDALVAGAKRAIDDANVRESQVIRVPGSFELPVVALAVARSGVDAVVALGVVIRGGTPHFEYVCRSVTDGLTRVALDTGVPIGFGILTCDNEGQALARAGLPDSSEDKGFEAAHAAMSTALTLADLQVL